MKMFGPNNTKYGSNFGYYVVDNILIYVISGRVTTVKLRSGGIGMCQVAEIGQMHEHLLRRPLNIGSRRREDNINMELIQDVSKMLEKTTRVSSSHQNKKKINSYKYMSGNEWFLSLTEILHSTINNLTLVKR
jgi:hypothetical protein